MTTSSPRAARAASSSRDELPLIAQHAEVAHHLVDIGQPRLGHAAQRQPQLQHIFPGAYVPSLREALLAIESAGFSTRDVENLRLHYALTMQHWLERFEKHADRVARRFDADFVRAWRLYLASSIAAFGCGSVQLFQLLFARPGYRSAWTRAGWTTEPHGAAQA